MKRLISLFLVLVLTLSLVPTVLAANDDALAAANELHALGLFNGTGTDANGDPIYDLDRAPSRHEAVTMLVRLLGKENEAKSGTWSLPFTDVADWAKPYVGYAYANGLTSGTSSTTFGGDAIVTASQYLTFVLRALGYTSSMDFQWDSAWTLSDDLCITGGQYHAETIIFTRGDAAIVSRNALSVPCKGTSTSLRDTISVSFAPAAPSVSSVEGFWCDKNHLNLHYSYFNGIYTEAHFNVTGEASLWRTGTYTVSDNKVRVTILSGLCKVGNNIIHAAETEWEKPLTFIDSNTMQLDSSLFIREADDSFLTAAQSELNALAEKQGITTIEAISPTPEPDDSADYTYLVNSDFRDIRSAYAPAVAQYGYVLTYTDANGDRCALTVVNYKIISSYTEYFLHNLTTGQRISAPSSYYDKQASRTYGANKLRYMELSSEVLKKQTVALRGVSDHLQTGNSGWRGAFVSAAELNL